MPIIITIVLLIFITTIIILIPNLSIGTDILTILITAQVGLRMVRRCSQSGVPRCWRCARARRPGFGFRHPGRETEGSWAVRV